MLSRLHQRPLRPTPTQDTWWTMHVDGSSNPQGAGAGIVLEGPGDILIEQSLRFNFKTSNNQAEYEAIIADLNLARESVPKNYCENILQTHNGTPQRRIPGQGHHALAVLPHGNNPHRTLRNLQNQTCPQK